jgi:hypothetical protein
MLISDAQRESRTVYVGGFFGQLVSGLIWFTSAAVATLTDPKIGFWTLAISGALIFPLTTALLRLTGRPSALSKENPLRYLAMQVAFTVPLALPLAGIAAIHNLGLFYPACMIIVGAHYLPFVFLYGMKTFAVLAAALLGAGYAIGMRASDQVLLGGWVGGAILCGFAFVLLAVYKRESPASEGQRPIPIKARA